MKKITILLASAGLLLSLPSCDEWLTATSSTQISDTQLFSSRNGFQEALSGIYLCMAQPECYGRDYTWFVSDLTAFPYAAQHNNNYISLQNHNYTNAVSFPIFTSMWQGGYHAIANINKMLQELDARRDVVSDETEYRLFRGELLGLRAWIHFDILRMWGRENWDGENAGKMTVPYVRTYEKEPTAQNSYAETARMLMADVNEAISMLSADPLRGNVSESFLTSVNTNGFWDNRTRHLNYYAAKGLKARVLLWEGEHREAAELAQEIIDEVLEKEVVRWIDPIAQLSTPDNDQRDWTFSTEHLFTLEVPDLYSTVQPYFFADISYSGIRIDPAVVSALFETPVGTIPGEKEGDPGQAITLISDIRGPAMQLRFSGAGYIPYKYYASSTSVYRNRLPMFRLSELYLTIAEDAFARNDLTTFLGAINEIHSHRGDDEAITPENIIRTGYSNPDGSTRWEADMDQLLLREYVIEMLGEGQILPFVKRFLRYAKYAFLVQGGIQFPAPAQLLFPYPSAETSYGHIQE